MPRHITEGNIVYRPEAYGAKGDGIADDTAAVVAAFTAANAKVRPGLVGGIEVPGATVQLTGIYNMASLIAPVQVKCNIAKNQAQLLMPAAYAGIGVHIGNPASGGYFTSADIHVPDVVKATNTPFVAGSTGVRVENLGNSVVFFGRTYYWETGIHLTGFNQGTVYNQINIGHIAYCQIGVKIKPDKAGGWANQNTFVGGSIQQSSGYLGGGIRRAGWRHVVLDGNTINNVNMNLFLGTSFEGDVSEYHIESRHASNNTFVSCRHEQGTLGTPVTVTVGTTITATAHPLAVNDMVTFDAVVTPGGLFISTPYYVTAVTADTFEVSMKRGGTAIAFTTTGTTVKFFRPVKVWDDNTDGRSGFNKITDPHTTMGLIDLVQTGASPAWTYETTDSRTLDTYSPADLPVHRVRGRLLAGTPSRAAYAAYPPAVNPLHNPKGWSMALSDRGLLFGQNEAEQARMFGSLGTLYYRATADAVSYEIPSWTRHQSAVTISSLALPANTTTTFSFAVPNVAVGEHVLVTMTTAPPGVVFSHAYVSSAGNITAVFGNITAGALTLNTTLKCMVARMFN